MPHAERPVGPDSMPGLNLRPLTVTVPLDHADPSAGSIEVFARVVTQAGVAEGERPYLVWFQGGPGNRADRPVAAGGWLGRAVRDYTVVLLDQRGTGRSAPIGRHTAARFAGNDEALARYLAHFRADSIVEDAEAVRVALGLRKWSSLGQSFGGFITLSYLSRHADALERSFITAGLPGVGVPAEETYARTFERTAARTDEFFAQFPWARQRAWDIHAHLLENDVRMPTGERLSVERFQSVGILLGTEGGYRQLAYLLESAFPGDGPGEVLGDAFVEELHEAVSFWRRPLYGVLHESIYADAGPTRWAAQRVRDGLPGFAPRPEVLEGRYPFTGEMVFPFQFDEDPALVPFAGAARILAEADWLAPVYDAEALAAQSVPLAAAVYLEDMFVPADLSLATASELRGARLDVTNRYQHDGIRQDGPALLERLFGLLGG